MTELEEKKAAPPLIEDDFIPTLLTDTDSKKLSNYELIDCAIIGVIAGFISSLIPFGLLIKVWYPLVGGKQLISGHHLIWAAIVYGLTKKKRSIIVTMFIKGLLEFMLGDTWGLIIIFANLMEGICLIGGFKIMELFGEKDTKLGWGLAGGLGNVVQAPFFWTLNQRWGLFPISLAILTFMFAFISGVLITGVLGKTVKDYLIKAGVPTSFN